jgi:uncharacterized integral membrane protein
MIAVLIALLISAWMGAIALLSVQNATPVTLRFLWFQSVELPMGIVLAGAAIAGLMLIVLIQSLWRLMGLLSGSDSRSDSRN